MVLDVKFMEWAATQGLDTAALKAARVPLYGKWYFPDLPLQIPMVNLRTGEIQTFAEPMVAGQTIWAPRDDLQHAGFWPPRLPGAPRDTPPSGADTSAASGAWLPLSLRSPKAALTAEGEELDHQFQPIGTLAILLTYLMVIIGLWLAMYLTLLQRG